MLTKNITKEMDTNTTPETLIRPGCFCTLPYRRNTPAIDAPALPSSAFFRSNPWADMASR